MAFYETEIRTKRDGVFKELNSGELVPGDIIEVPQFKKMPCDAILLDGLAVMNEAMLTGESVPVVKAPLDRSDKLFYGAEDKKNTLYSGTDVI